MIQLHPRFNNVFLIKSGRTAYVVIDDKKSETEIDWNEMENLDFKMNNNDLEEQSTGTKNRLKLSFDHK